MVLNPRQFNDSPSDVPPPFGTKPIPEGHIRISHYTGSEEDAESIRQHGLLRSHAEESFAHGGTEYPQIFATAGAPSDNLLRARPVIEAHADPTKELDTNSLLPVQNTPENRADMERRGSTVTFHGDVPPAHVLSVHQPWHSPYRYLQDNPGMEHGIMHGEYEDTGDEPTDRAIAATKVALAAKVMLGGKLRDR